MVLSALPDHLTSSPAQNFRTQDIDVLKLEIDPPEPVPEPFPFKFGDDVIVRDDTSEDWRWEKFVRLDHSKPYPVVCSIDTARHIAPLKYNESLIMTNEDPGEWWNVDDGKMVKVYKK